MKKLLLLTITICSIGQGFTQKRKFGRITKEELKEKVCSVDSTAAAAYLYKTKDVSFEYDDERGFRKNVKVHEIIKIYDDKAFTYGDQIIKYYNESDYNKDRFYKIKATTYNLVNNKIEETDVDRKEIFDEEYNEYYGLKKIAFPNLKKGSIIELFYEVVSVYLDIDDFKIQEEIPIKFIYHRTIIPEYFKFNKSSKGYISLVPEVTSKYGKVFVGKGSERVPVDFTEEHTVFKGKNIQALKNDEPFTASYNDYVGTVGYELSYIDFPYTLMKRYATSWESVCERLYDHSEFGDELKKHNYFSDDLAQAIAGKTSEIEIINAVFNLVKSKVTWNQYTGIYTHNGVSNAYKKGEGNVADINLMLVAMLREAGINANPVLSSTKEHGTPLFPTLEGLNYVIAAVESTQGGRILLDATNPYHAINFLPSRALNWQGRLLISRGQTLIVPLAVPKKSQENCIVNVAFDEGFNLTGTLQSKYTNRQAYNFRTTYNSLSDEKFKEKITEDYHMHLKSYDIKNKYNLFEPLMFSAQLEEGNQFSETIDEKKYINPMLFFKETENPFKLETRKYPVDLVAPSVETKSITINIPEGYKVSSLPKGLHAKMSDGLGSYKYLIQQMGNRIVLLSVLNFNTHMILPNKYEELRSLYAAMLSKHKEQIVLEKIL